MNIAILGFGVVGSGVYEIIRKNAVSIARKAEKEINIKYIIDIKDFSAHQEAKLFTSDFGSVLEDDSVSVIIEVMGGLRPAYEFTKAALLAGKHVVTSNKELVAKHGTELLSIAKENNINYFFEASVGGGIPIIRPLNQCLAANEIGEIYGILNGTTNYILTRMVKDGIDFDTALNDAQKKGYAEANPSADIDGIDACRKTAILASLAFGKEVNSERIETEGITKITGADMAYAESANCAVKLIGYAMTDGYKVGARVAPMFIEKSNSLSGVEDVFNAIMVKGDSIGEVMFYGRGAGKLPTASAVVADIIDIAKHPSTNRIGTWEKAQGDIMLDINEKPVSLFVRMKAENKKQVQNEITAVFGEGVKFINAGFDNEIAFITEVEKENTLCSKIDSLHHDMISCYRVLD